MKPICRINPLPLVLVVTLVLAFAGAARAELVVIRGEVNDSYQIVADGQIYEVAETPEGNDLVEKHISETVEIVATIEEKDDVKIITVHSYRVLGE